MNKQQEKIRGAAEHGVAALLYLVAES